MTKKWITEWAPEDADFWRRTGRRVAHRNLVFSIFAEHLGFSVWLMWSIVVVSLPAAGFAFSADQLLWLVALPNLVGAFLRIPYTMAVARVGGREWTVISAALLAIPLLLLAYCVTTPGTPYWVFLVAAATAGLGGGNFASSMANISYFYPQRHKGTALGVNAAGGNIGVAFVQLIVPAVIGVAAGLVNAALLYLVLVVLAAVCAWRFMDNLSAVRATVTTQLSVLRNKHTWIMSFLYIGTFGSFIGYSAAFPLLINTEFSAGGTGLAFLGPLVGSLSRPVGGWLADRVGGARVTAATFVLMGASVGAVLGSLNVHSFPLFLGSFLALFVLSGIGNGSTYQMIPAIFLAEARRSGPSSNVRTPFQRGRNPLTTLCNDAMVRSHNSVMNQAAAVIGLASAIGAFGGFLIPRGFGISMSRTGSISAALLVFLAGYVVCLVMTWWCYLRKALTEQPSRVMAEI